MKEVKMSKPHLLIMTGIPGSGKSQFANRFSKLFEAPLVSWDVIRKSLSKGPSFDAAGTSLVKDLVDLQLNELFKTKTTMVYDGPVETEAQRVRLAKQCGRVGYETLFIWVQTDQPTANKRAAKNGLSNNEITMAGKRFVKPGSARPFLVISGKHTFASQLKIVLTYLSKLEQAEQPPAKR